MSVSRILFMLVFVLGFYGGGTFYIARRLYQWLLLLFPSINARVYIGIFIFIATSFLFSFLPLPMMAKGLLRTVGAYWMGFFVCFLVLFAVADAVVWVGGLIRLVPSPMPEIVHFYKSLTVVVLAVGVIFCGMYNAHQIKVTSYEIQLNDAALHDMKIVLISDLHLGDVNSEPKLERMVQMINDLQPDLVCIAGDIFNDDFNTIKDPDRAAALLGSISATYGVFACLGNHDGGGTLAQMTHFLEAQSGIRLLNDEYVIIDDRVALFGRLDASPIGGFGALARRDINDDLMRVSQALPVIVMEHNPAHIGEYTGTASLILAGHTHRGQMFPGRFVTNAMFEVDYGYYQRDENHPHVVVTSGVSTWMPPMRVGTYNEIVSIVVR
jgi:hypothetical protein